MLAYHFVFLSFEQVESQQALNKIIFVVQLFVYIKENK